jgi:hypothetical protein
MPVTVDHEPMKTDELGLRTVGQVLSHLKKANRLVVNVVIDGQAPDLNRMADLRQRIVGEHTIFIETAEPKTMALEILQQVEAQLGLADQLKSEATELLRKNQNVKALEKLSGCFATWQNAQQSLLGTAQLLKIDLDEIFVSNRKLSDVLGDVTDQLKQIKSALENRDFVSLSDLLIYETTQTTSQWQEAVVALRQQIQIQ